MTVPDTSPRTILLGPQRFTTTVRPALATLDLAPGPIAVINPGWEERESEESELQTHLDGRGRNLGLYARTLDVMTKDDVLALAVLDFRAKWDELRANYAIRIDAALGAASAVQRRTSKHGQREAALDACVAALRDVDDWYRAEVKRLYRELGTHASIIESPIVGWHRGEIAAILQDAAAVVMPGGRVDVLLQSLRLFDIHLPDSVPVIAWSAGAMALTERVVLFHDHATGFTAPELFDHGLGRLGGIVALPHARRRLALEDEFRMRMLARRFPDRACVLLDDGAMLTFDSANSANSADSADSAGGTRLPVGARVIDSTGSISVVGA